MIQGTTPQRNVPFNTLWNVAMRDDPANRVSASTDQHTEDDERDDHGALGLTFANFPGVTTTICPDAIPFNTLVIASLVRSQDFPLQ